MYIANERDDAIVYTLGLSADGLRLRAMAHLSINGLTGDDRFDISDLYFENGFLYVLHRRAARILKLDPGSRRIVGSFDAGFAVTGLYHPPGIRLRRGAVHDATGDFPPARQRREDHERKARGRKRRARRARTAPWILGFLEQKRTHGFIGPVG